MRKALLLTVLFSTAAFASEGAGGELFWKTVNSLILLAIIVIIAKKYVVKYFSNRQNTIQSMIEEAKKAKEESEKALADARKQLEDAETKFKETIKIAEETAKKEREAALNEAKEIAERIKAQAKEAVEIEVKKGEAKLKEYAVRKALEASEQIIKEKINPQTNKAVIKNVIKQLEA